MNKIRKIIQLSGFDFHRHHRKAEKIDYLKNLNIHTVIDVGANIGQFAMEIRSVIPKARIYSFEPLKECYEKLNINMSGDNNFFAYNFALGEKEDNIEMQKNEYLPSSSLLQMSKNHTDLFPHTKNTTSEKIKVKKLDDVCEELNLEKDILIKMDAQGYEDKIINGGKKVISKSKYLLIETSFVELYKGQPLFNDIYKQVSELGFKYAGSIQEKVEKNTGKIISEDSLFTRD